ncbi:MAG: hypothetical protein K940chlam6_01074 [Chlamydiae bacterium]|nr:hypothetical protein [Chlamydiota bacterium]
MTKPLLLITGIAGRIGSAAAALFSEHFQIVGLDIAEPEMLNEKIDYIFTDISSLENVRDSLNKVKEKYGDQIAAFIHLAAYYDFTGGAWDKYQKITINGTDNLLTVLQDFQLDQFIFSSTMLVYAPCKMGEKISEGSPLDPKWEYPLSKVKTEELILEKRGKASSVILRIAGVYDDDCNSIPISQHILRIYRKELESHFFPGNVHHGASFLHMEDLIRALLLIVEKRKELDPEEVFVLGESEVMSFQDLQNELGRLIHGKPWWTIRIPKWFAKMGAWLKKWLQNAKKSFIQPWMIDIADDHYDLDIQKAKELLGFEPAHNLKNCLPEIIGKFKKNPQKWIEHHEI